MSGVANFDFNNVLTYIEQAINFITKTLISIFTQIARLPWWINTIITTILIILAIAIARYFLKNKHALHKHYH